ncbi:MAG: hypothetical protein EU539_08900 [Promethearchaeota archaeon]|nr:MAG: hypothetical protein EU539_08900 [Candidatus Lokiarchaeota archaeon]
MTRRRGDVSNAGIVRLLAGIGAIIFLILAIFSFMGFSANAIICGLLLLVVGLIVLISCFGSYRSGIPFSAVFILVMGIVGIIIGWLCGGIFGIIAGILIFVAGIVGLL